MQLYRARHPRRSRLWQWAHRHFATRGELARYYGWYSNKMRSQRQRVVIEEILRHLGLCNGEATDYPAR